LALGATRCPDSILSVLLDQLPDPDAALTSQRARVRNRSGEPYVIADEVSAVGIGLKVVDVHLPYSEVARAISPVVRLIATRHLPSSFASAWIAVELQRPHRDLIGRGRQTN
jgi:hypothetical protein